MSTNLSRRRAILAGAASVPTAAVFPNHLGPARNTAGETRMGGTGKPASAQTAHSIVHSRTASNSSLHANSLMLSLSRQ
jgi:hypothetical protein